MVTGKGDEQSAAAESTSASEATTASAKVLAVPLDKCNFANCKTEASSLRRALEA